MNVSGTMRKWEPQSQKQQRKEALILMTQGELGSTNQKYKGLSDFRVEHIN